MTLTAEEKQFIKENEKLLEEVLSSLAAVKQFKEGDYLIAFEPPSPWNSKKRPIVNSYGAPKKFQVVYVDKHGVPYMKELNKKGKPIGGLVSSIQHNHSHSNRHTSLTYAFEVDPDYTDSIILQDQENYNAGNILKEKSDTFKEISIHNKNIKINTNDPKLLSAFLATLKVGDILWRSNISCWNVTQIDPLPKDKAGRIQYHQHFLKVINNKGKNLYLTFSNLNRLALYTARPRTYKELRDPK